MLDPAWFWTLLGTYEGERIVLDNWQIADLHDYSRIRFREKAPQIGFSWLRAAEAVWESIMFVDALTGFVSVNEREASEKVLYSRKLYDGLPDVIKGWVPISRDSTDQMDFGDPARPSRIMSIPATSALRGRRMTQVVLDESDFYKDGGLDMYRVAIGRVSRSGGRVSMGSTCFGQDTMLDRGMQGIGQDGHADRAMNAISRARYPWTVVENPEVIEAIDLARATLDADAFAEEYEGVRGGLGGAPFPAELIRRQTHSGASAAMVDNELVWNPGGMLAGGFDVGQTRNPSCLSLFEKVPGEPWREVALVKITRPNGSHLSLPEQHEWLRGLLAQWPMMRLCVDARGIGAHISQLLEKEFGIRRVVSMVVGSKPQMRRPQDKREMVTELKRALEARELELLPDKERALQMRRTVRKPNGDYDQPGSNKDTHYDLFWATAYAQYLIAEYGRLDSVYNHRSLAVVGG